MTRLLIAALLALGLTTAAAADSAWRAKWIWCAGEESPRNFYLYARKTFTLDASPGRALARCTADSRYKLYVNGHFVGRGPARCDPRWQYYETYDLRPYLRGGENVVAALVHHYGEGSGQYLLGRGGFLFEARLQTRGREHVIATDETWRVLPAAAWDRSTPRVSGQLGFQEVYDARQEPGGWNDIAFDDSAWQAAVVIGEVGVAPWTSLVERDIPPLREQEVFPLAVLDVGRAEMRGPLFHFDLAAMFRPNHDAVAYLYTEVHSPIARTVDLGVGHDDGLKLWVNGTQVVNRHRHGAARPDEVRVPVQLRPGWNPLLVKLDQGHGPWEFYLRMVDRWGAQDLEFSAGSGARGAAQWMAIGPFPNPRQGEEICPGFDTAYPPEREVDFTAQYEGEQQMVRWQPAPTGTAQPRDVCARMALEAHLPLHGARVHHVGALLRADGKATVVHTSLSLTGRGQGEGPLPAPPAPLITASEGMGAARDSGGVFFTLDFGREVVGYPRIRVNAPAGAVIELGYDEVLEDFRVNPNRGVVHADRFITRQGAQTYELFDKRGFRYMQVTVRDCPGPVEIESVSLNFATYPVERRGRFSCSDPLLERIWKTGAYTVQLCMEDAYEDCPWRERAQWWGDARIEALVNYYAFGDLALIRKGLRQIAQSQTPEGVTQAFYPGGGGTIIPDFCAIWVISLWDYYLHSGDLAAVRELYPNVQRALAWFAAHMDQHGLLNNVPHWVFIDWADVDKRGEVTALNCFYYQALRTAADLARALGDAASARGYAARAEVVASAVNRRLWSEERGAYLDCRAGDELSDRVSQQANALAVCFGIAGPERAHRALDYILDPTKPVVPMGSPYFSFYLQRALWQSGRDETALRLIRERWGDMLRRGATTWWETWGGGSRCHGWSSAPTYDLSAQVLGITPATPGYAAVRFRPHLVDLEYAQGVVPTPRGDVFAAWRRTAGGVNLTLRLPRGPGIRPEVSVPVAGPQTTIILNGRKVWQGGKLIPGAGVVAARQAPGVEGAAGHIVLVLPIASGKTYEIAAQSPPR